MFYIYHGSYELTYLRGTNPKDKLMSIRHTRGIYFGSGYFAGADIISKKMVNGYFACTDYCRITIIITIIKTKQKCFEKFEMIIIIVK